MTFQLTLSGHVTPDDKARNDYAYVPFDLPTAATWLRARYSYTAPMSADQLSGGNVIDIGLFDPRGAAFPGSAGFRGWSGSARSEFYITNHDATPGYLPGPLPAGTYQVVLGLYRIQPAGADYAITIEAALEGAADDTPILQERIENQAQNIVGTSTSPADEFVWLRGDLQSHTEHSDARGSIAQLTTKARALGLDFLAITDHNTISHHAHLPAFTGDDLLLIPGQESTTYRGRMNIWGTSRWCDFRARTSDDMAQMIALAHTSGALCSINHPKAGGPAWEYRFDLSVDAIEVWQGPWPWRNTESVALWDRLLMEGRQLPGVGGSDYHCPAGEEQGFLRLGQPTTWVQARERSVAAILDAIRAGRVSISSMPAGPRLDQRASAHNATAGMGEVLTVSANTHIAVEVDVERGAGWTLQLIADGEVAYREPITTVTSTVRCTIAAAHYVRAELVGAAPPDLLPATIPAGLDLTAWRWALTNPVYVVDDT